MHIRNLRSSCKNIIAAIPQGLATIEQDGLFTKKILSLDLDEFAESEISSIGPIDEINYDYQVVGASVIPAGQQILTVAAR